MICILATRTRPHKEEPARLFQREKFFEPLCLRGLDYPKIYIYRSKEEKL